MDIAQVKVKVGMDGKARRYTSWGVVLFPVMRTSCSLHPDLEMNDSSAEMGSAPKWLIQFEPAQRRDNEGMEKLLVWKREIHPGETIDSVLVIVEEQDTLNKFNVKEVNWLHGKVTFEMTLLRAEYRHRATQFGEEGCGSVELQVFHRTVAMVNGSVKTPRRAIMNSMSIDRGQDLDLAIQASQIRRILSSLMSSKSSSKSESKKWRQICVREVGEWSPIKQWCIRVVWEGINERSGMHGASFAPELVPCAIRKEETPPKRRFGPLDPGGVH
ncbi:hypothetical protein B0H12DRAFT_1082099, partial [Mycena haematopus]